MLVRITILITKVIRTIHSKTTKILLTNRYHDVLKRESEEASKDTEIYLSNPLNAYSIVKHLTVDWKNILNIVKESGAKTGEN